jgi:hypothetical protein
LTKQELALKYADEAVGKKEQGKNAGIYVETLLWMVGLGKGYPWCAAFVSAYLRKAGLKSGPRKGRAAVRNWAKWADEVGAHVTLDYVRPGDLFYWLNPNGTGHIGFVRDIFFHGPKQAWKIKTIEGNSNAEGSREGDGVYRKLRLVHNLKFIRVTS